VIAATCPRRAKSGEGSPSRGRHCHSALSLTVIDCHFLGIYTVVLLSFSIKMTVSPRARLTVLLEVCPRRLRQQRARPLLMHPGEARRRRVGQLAGGIRDDPVAPRDVRQRPAPLRHVGEEQPV
jgi:hypothetical protein